MPIIIFHFLYTHLYTSWQLGIVLYCLKYISDVLNGTKVSKLSEIVKVHLFVLFRFNIQGIPDLEIYNHLFFKITIPSNNIQ